jgi:hypothetical protein
MTSMADLGGERSAPKLDRSGEEAVLIECGGRAAALERFSVLDAEKTQE